MIEIKRNLRNQLNGSISHVSEIISQAGLSKNDDTQTIPFANISMAPGNAIQTSYRSNPIIGIIALQSGYNTYDGFLNVPQRAEQENSLVDFVWCIDGASIMTERGGNIFPQHCRNSNDSWVRVDPNNNVWNVNFAGNAGATVESILMRLRGFIVGYLMQTTGKNFGQEYINNYYFNNNIFGAQNSVENQ